MVSRERVYQVAPPSLEGEFDLQGHLDALPPDAKNKGMFNNLAIDHAAQHQVGRAQLFDHAGVSEQVFRAFLDYPYEKYLRLMAAAAELSYPKLSVKEGIRRIGRGSYPMFMGTQIGRVLYAVAGSDINRALSAVQKGYRLSLSFGKVRHEPLGDKHAALHYRDMPAMLESCQLGVLEGGLEWFGVSGSVELQLHSLSEATFELWWE